MQWHRHSVPLKYRPIVYFFCHCKSLFSSPSDPPPTHCLPAAPSLGKASRTSSFRPVHNMPSYHAQGKIYLHVCLYSLLRATTNLQLEHWILKDYKISNHNVPCSTNSEYWSISPKVSKTRVILTHEIYFWELVRGIIVITVNDYGRVTVTAGEATFEIFLGGE